MKKLIFTVTFALLVFTGLDKSYSQKLTGEDDRIIITVDSIGRADIFPERLIPKDISGKPNYGVNPPKGGFDFAIVHVHWVEKKDLKIENSEIRISDIYLYDDIGDTYKVKWGEFNYTFKPEISEYWVFLMPKDKKPVQMKYSYQYREELPKSQEIKFGMIDIKL